MSGFFTNKRHIYIYTYGFLRLDFIQKNTCLKLGSCSATDCRLIQDKLEKKIHFPIWYKFIWEAAFYRNRFTSDDVFLHFLI